MAAGFSTSTTAIGYPFDSLTALVQVGSSSGKQLTGADVVNKVRTLSGISGHSISFICFMLTRSDATLLSHFAS
ncbi:hypothetical protein T459_35327 [Capsicum annuum]|uniref:Uncharacterized protein n=1 Tax=Capsicum annuum TaxID=4072 RepID=A0A2G2XTL7_CAPAN|nr:hypothetical protein T459_35327 [Capsicum annuum]